jgi:hypothetical protein
MEKESIEPRGSNNFYGISKIEQSKKFMLGRDIYLLLLSLIILSVAIYSAFDYSFDKDKPIATNFSNDLDNDYLTPLLNDSDIELINDSEKLPIISDGKKSSGGSSNNHKDPEPPKPPDPEDPQINCSVLIQDYPIKTDFYDNFDDWETWNGWYDGVFQPERTFLISPIIDVGLNNEQIHHNLTVEYESSQSNEVRAIIGHYAANNIPNVMNTTYRTNGDLFVESGQKIEITTQYRSERYSWIILEILDGITLTNVTHNYWIGNDTEYGHDKRVFNFVDGSYLPYTILLPKNYNSSKEKKYPLVVSCPGSTSISWNNGAQMSMTTYGRYAFERYYGDERFESISIVPLPVNIYESTPQHVIPYPYYPNGTQGGPREFYPSWHYTNVDGFYAEATIALINDLIDNCSLKVDENKIYYTGNSLGGVASYEIMKENSTIWASVWPLEGWPIGSPYQDYTDLPEDDPMIQTLQEEISIYKHIPIQIGTTENDGMVYGGELACREIKKQGGVCTHHIFSGGSHGGAAGRSFTNIEQMEWFFSQTNNRECIDEDLDGYGACPNCGTINGCENDLGDCDDSNNSLWKTNLFYEDLDLDGYGSKEVIVCSAGEDINNGVLNNDDCDDNDIEVYRKRTVYEDLDGDGFGNNTEFTEACIGEESPVGYSFSGSDCDDSNSSLFQLAYAAKDLDGDGYGNDTFFLQRVCTNGTLPRGYVQDWSDCNDINNLINQDAEEICDDLDNNCNDEVDEGDVCVIASLNPFGRIINWFKELFS